ncbi:MAG: single-stranded DNA-binding protein [Candidatus Brocadiia bacterium]
MPNYNRVILMGNLTRDPELRYTPSGTAVADFGLAMNRRFRANNERREETTFVDVTAWGRTAEIINEYFCKGRPIFLEGRLTLDEWTSQDGQQRRKLKVVLENFQFITPRGQGGERRSQRPQRQDAQSAPQENQDSEESEPFDDVPF